MQPVAQYIEAAGWCLDALRDAYLPQMTTEPLDSLYNMDKTSTNLPDNGYCNPRCPHLQSIQPDGYARCALMERQLIYYDGWLAECEDIPCENEESV